MIVLRDYQEKMVKELLQAYNDKVMTCVVSPTGSGKTVCIKEFINRILAQHKDLKICVTVHRLEILENLKDTINNDKVEFLTIQKLSRMSDYMCDILIIDESSHTASPSYRQILGNNCKWHCGFTATSVRGLMPEYPDYIQVYKESWKTELTGLYSEELYTNFITSLDTSELIKQGYLSDYEMVHDIDFHIKHTGSMKVDYTKKEIDTVINDNECIEYVKQTIGDKKAIIFCHSIDFAKSIDKGLGDTSVLITSKTNKQDRLKHFKDFKNNKINILVNVDIFSEGVDVPSVDCVYLFRPTRSLSVYFQQIGRALRIAKGKDKAIIYDYVNNYKRLGVTPKDVKLKDMILKTKFIKEKCVYCGAYGVIEGKYDKECNAVPNEHIRRISKWLTKFKDLYYFKPTKKKFFYTVELNPNNGIGTQGVFDYYDLFAKRTFAKYTMPIILNQYNRWEIMSPKNVALAVKTTNGECLLLKGDCKYSDNKHDYFLILENMLNKNKKVNPKIKL